MAIGTGGLGNFNPPAALPSPTFGQNAYAPAYPYTGLASLLEGLTKGVELGTQFKHQENEEQNRTKQLENEADYHKIMLGNAADREKDLANHRAAMEKLYGQRIANLGKGHSAVATAWSKSPEAAAMQAYDAENQTNLFDQKLMQLDQGNASPPSPDMAQALKDRAAQTAPAPAPQGFFQRLFGGGQAQPPAAPAWQQFNK